MREMLLNQCEHKMIGFCEKCIQKKDFDWFKNMIESKAKWTANEVWIIDEILLELKERKKELRI